MSSGLAIVAVGLLLVGRALAGGLDPTNAPAPTMHTLEEIYQRLLLIPTNAGGSGYSAPVAKTGQTNSYTTSDDGALQKGVTWPNPRFTVQADTNVVKDNLTGLMWARNANLSGGSPNWNYAVAYCTNLTYGGYSDWRLPNVRELLSLVDFGWGPPALCNTAGTGQWTQNDPFTGVQSGYYWSSTTDAGYTSYAWYVHLYDGYVYFASSRSM